MTQLAAKGRVLTLVLGLFYIFTGSGLDRLTYQCVSMIHRTVVFPCKGKGCQCDKAGYELLNCQCRHEDGISCCSTETGESPDEAPNTNEQCCEKSESQCIAISNIPCQGEEETLQLSLHKHILLEIDLTEEIAISKKPLYISSHENLISSELLPGDKVPIFS